MRRSYLLLIAALAAAPPARGQDTTRAVPGDSVRISAPAVKLQGATAVFVAVRGDSVVLRGLEGDSAPRAVALASVSVFQVKRGVRSAAVEGLFLGALVGLTAGAIATVECPGIWNSCHSDPGVSFTAMAVGGVAGTLVGAFVKVTDWRTVKLAPETTATVRVSARSVGVRVTIRM